MMTPNLITERWTGAAHIRRARCTRKSDQFRYAGPAEYLSPGESCILAGSPSLFVSGYSNLTSWFRRMAAVVSSQELSQGFAEDSREDSRNSAHLNHCIWSVKTVSSREKGVWIHRESNSRLQRSLTQYNDGGAGRSSDAGGNGGEMDCQKKNPPASFHSYQLESEGYPAQGYHWLKCLGMPVNFV